MEQITAEALEEMRNTNIEDVDINTLADIREIEIDSSKPVRTRLYQFASQTPNVYINRFDDYVVKVSYANTNLTINDKIRGWLKRTAEINY